MDKNLQRVKNYVSKTSIPNRYDMPWGDAVTIANSYDSVYDIIWLAFKYGFEKGCRATKKAVSV